MSTTTRPTRMPSFMLPWKRVKAIKAPEIVVAPASPATTSEEANAQAGSPPHRYNEWMPSLNTGSSDGSQHSNVSSPHSDYSRYKDLPSPPPAYEAALIKLQPRISHGHTAPSHIGLCQKLAESVAMKYPPESTQLPLLATQPVSSDWATRKSSFAPEVVVAHPGIEGSFCSNKIPSPSKYPPRLPPIDTRVAFSARNSPVPALKSATTARHGRSVSASSSEPHSGKSCDCSHHTSPSSVSTLDDEFQRPVTIFQTEGQCWVFPDVTISDAIARITSDSIRIEPLTDNDGSGRSSGSGSASSNASPTSANTSSPTGPGNKRRRNGGRGNQNAKSVRRQTGQSGETKAKPLKYGCPFAKHNPERYSGVFNSCTNCPGIEWKYLIEHLTRVHNANTRCIYCNEVWSTPNWERELQHHHDSGACPQKDKIMSKPECMTADQERVYKDTNEQGHPDKRWVSLFMRLFPNSWPIPNPRYNYYVARHRIVTPTRSNTSSPTEPGAVPPPQTRTWYIFSRNNDEDDYNSPDSSPNQDTGGIFSTHTTQPAVNQVGFPIPPISYGASSTAMPLGVPAQHATSGWIDQSIVEEHGYLYGLGDANFADNTNALVMPEGEADGHGLLQKWVGQNVPEGAHMNTLNLF